MNKAVVRILLLLALLPLGCGTPSVEAQGPIEASGTIEGREIVIAAEVGGTVAELAVREGDEVAPGDLLLRLDDRIAQAQRAEAEAAVRTAEANLARVKAGPRPQEIAAAEAAVAAAQARRDGAYTAWQDALAALEAPQDLDVQIAAAQSDLEIAKKEVERLELELKAVEMKRNLTEEGTDDRKVQDAVWRATKEAIEAAKANQRVVEIRLYWLRKRKEEPLKLQAQANAAEGAYRLAEAALRVAQAKLAEAKAGPTPEEIAVAEAQVRQAKAALGLLQVQQEKLTLTAPAGGLVSSVEVHRGEAVLAGTPLLTLVQLDPVVLTLYIPEEKIGLVKVGQRVEVSVDSFPGETFVGQVVHIAEEAEFTPRNVQTKEERVTIVFAVKVHIPNPDGRLKPGMPADAVIVGS